MPYDVDGWVEFSFDISNGCEDAPMWLPALLLTPFRLDGDEISHSLFGLAKVSNPSAPFFGRGIPTDASELVRRRYAENLEFIEKNGEGDFGHTHALLSEVQTVDFSSCQAELQQSPWSDVFKSVNALPRFLVETPASIRFVVWANW